MRESFVPRLSHRRPDARPRTARTHRSKPDATHRPDAEVLPVYSDRDADDADVMPRDSHTDAE